MMQSRLQTSVPTFIKIFIALNIDSAVSFMDPLVDTNPINTADQEFCDRPAALKEIVDSINILKNNKSAGVDGITSEFYKSFSKELAPFLLEVFCESITVFSLPL